MKIKGWRNPFVLLIAGWYTITAVGSLFLHRLSGIEATLGAYSAGHLPCTRDCTLDSAAGFSRADLPADDCQKNFEPGLQSSGKQTVHDANSCHICQFQIQPRAPVATFAVILPLVLNWWSPLVNFTEVVARPASPWHSRAPPVPNLV
ncbi:hypothetical protein THTE_3998 [Thermogutta terrifontis]|uniref:Uncharacterized protein n=1 Tax=Thermogutta terrifontis TaxID=1331910 RepID=A0A286RKU3_9BACT|nr:hypothetical protein THTE_3998 [Thermogutta terrifontis]